MLAIAPHRQKMALDAVAVRGTLAIPGGRHVLSLAITQCGTATSHDCYPENCGNNKRAHRSMNGWPPCTRAESFFFKRNHSPGEGGDTVVRTMRIFWPFSQFLHSLFRLVAHRYRMNGSLRTAKVRLADTRVVHPVPCVRSLTLRTPCARNPSRDQSPSVRRHRSHHRPDSTRRCSGGRSPAGRWSTHICDASTPTTRTGPRSTRSIS